MSWSYPDVSCRAYVKPKAFVLLPQQPYHLCPSVLMSNNRPLQCPGCSVFKHKKRETALFLPLHIPSSFMKHFLTAEFSNFLDIPLCLSMLSYQLFRSYLSEHGPCSGLLCTVNAKPEASKISWTFLPLSCSADIKQ